MRRSLILLCAVLGLVLTRGSAQAGYELRFADSSGAETTSFTLDYAQSPTLDIRVYLVATGADAPGFSLSSYGAQLNYSTTANAKVLATTDITSNPAFNGIGARAVGPDFARSRDTVLSGSVPGTTSGSDSRILLGTFRFTGLTNGENIMFTADPTGTEDTRLGDGTLIDSLIAGQSATITVINVPEPGTIMLSSLLAMGMVGGAVRRLRRTA